MSTVDFNRRFTASVSINASVSIAKSGLLYKEKAYDNYEATAQVTYSSGESDLTIREEVCAQEPDFQKIFTRPAFASGITDSGYSYVGFPNYAERDFRARNSDIDYGNWIVNTSPVITVEETEMPDSGTKSELKINGDTVTDRRFYTVKHPQNLGKDVPIYAPNGVGGYGNRPLYEGDILLVEGASSLGTVIRKKRYPSSDRTFFWSPNTSPVLTRKGYADGVLMKPGTVMIPTITTSLSPSDGGVELPPNVDHSELLQITYVYAGHGIMFDGDDWVALDPRPGSYLKKNNTWVYRNFLLHKAYLDPDQPHNYLVEKFFSHRPLILFRPEDITDSVGTITLTEAPPETPTGGTGDGTGGTAGTESFDLYVGPTIFRLLYDFGDAWSAYHQANKDWKDALFIELEVPQFFFVASTNEEYDPVTGEPLPELLVGMSVQADTFRDGDITNVEYKDEDGKVTYSSSISVNYTVTYANT